MRAQGGGRVFSNNLYNRGLTGEMLGLIITDGNAGLENASGLCLSESEKAEVLGAQTEERIELPEKKRIRTNA